MRKASVLDRILLLAMVLVAAYQVVVGLDKFKNMVVFYFTISFGVLIIAGLLLVLFGYEILQNSLVVVVAALIPLSLSLGLILTYYPKAHFLYLLFSIAGLFAITITRFSSSKTISTITLAVVHGVAGIIIFILPIFLYAREKANPSLLFISLGASLIGIGGFLLALIQTGKPLLPRETVFKLLPWILLVMTVAFSIGLGAIP